MRCKLCGFLRNRKNQSKCGSHKQVLARRLFMWGMWARMWTRMRRHLYTNPCDDRHHLCRHVTRSVVRLFCVLMVGWQTNFPPLINFALGLACFMTIGWGMSLSAHHESKKNARRQRWWWCLLSSQRCRRILITILCCGICMEFALRYTHIHDCIYFWQFHYCLRHDFQWRLPLSYNLLQNL